MEHQHRSRHVFMASTQGGPPRLHSKGLEHAKEILDQSFNLSKIHQPRESNPYHPPQEEQTLPSLIFLPPEEQTKIMPFLQEVSSPWKQQPPTTHQSTWPTNLIKIIWFARNIPCNQPSAPEFSFTFDLKSAKKNYIILMKRHQGSLKWALDANKDPPLE